MKDQRQHPGRVDGSRSRPFGPWLAGLASLILLGSGSGSVVGAASPAASIRVSVTGPAEVVIPPDRFTCPPSAADPLAKDAVDAPLRAFRTDDGKIRAYATSAANYSFAGPDLTHLAHEDCTPTLPEVLSSDPASFANRRWLFSAYRSGSSVVGLVHNEYMGWLYNPAGECPAPAANTWRCWYLSVGLVSSQDGGRTFAPDPGRMTLSADQKQGIRPLAALPYRFTRTMGAAGYGNPSNILKNPHDGAYYAFITAAAFGAQQTGACLLRSTDLVTWNFWDGQDFKGTFIDPYTSTDQAPEAHVCKTVFVGGILSVVYVPKYDVFVGALNKVGGLAITVSDDLINWRPTQDLLPKPTDGTLIHYPAILDETSTSINFEDVGDHPYLYYMRRKASGADRGVVRSPLLITTR